MLLNKEMSKKCHFTVHSVSCHPQPSYRGPPAHQNPHLPPPTNQHLPYVRPHSLTPTSLHDSLSTLSICAPCFLSPQVHREEFSLLRCLEQWVESPHQPWTSLQSPTPLSLAPIVEARGAEGVTSTLTTSLAASRNSRGESDVSLSKLSYTITFYFLTVNYTVYI